MGCNGKKCSECIGLEDHLFRYLSNAEIEELYKHKVEKRYAKGDIIVEHGQPANGLYCIERGSCKLHMMGPQGMEQIMRFVNKGSLVGFRAVISESPYSLSATALENTITGFIPQSAFKALLLKNQYFSQKMTESLCREVVRADAERVKLAQQSVRQRFGEALIMLTEMFGTCDDGYINQVITRKEFASYIGSTVETIIRLISNLKKEGLIDTDGKKIKIINKKKLIFD